MDNQGYSGDLGMGKKETSKKETSKQEYTEDSALVKAHGLTMIIAAIFLAGEMAGSGVLALPSVMVGTGPAGLVLIAFFALVSMFSGTRLGVCWIILEERYPKLRDQVRDPYPAIADKAMGNVWRLVTLVILSITQYGTCCVYLVLMANFLSDLTMQAGYEFNTCYWMLVIAVAITPVCWLGTPNDMWQIAVGALVTTVTACILIMTQVGTESGDKDSCYFKLDNGTQFDWEPVFPKPTTEGYLKAFSTIMFAFAGAPTFPTIQADMRDRRKFPLSATIAMIILMGIYVPMASVGYFSLGGDVSGNIVNSLCQYAGRDKIIKIVVEVLYLLHLVSVFPIMCNPPNLFFEEVLKIPQEFNIKRCIFRSLVVVGLLCIAESLPNFGSILDLVGGSAVTLLTFVFPPLFYMKLVEKSSLDPNWKQRTVSVAEKVLCWAVIVIGVAGGCAATYNAVRNIIDSAFTPPCYVKLLSESISH